MNNISLNPDDRKSSGSAVGVILAVVCALSGVYAGVQLAKFSPIWLAVLITVAIGLVLVGSLAASLGNDLMDVVIGCVVVIIVMAVVLPVGAKAFRRHFPAAKKVEQSTFTNHANVIFLVSRVQRISRFEFR